MLERKPNNFRIPDVSKMQEVVIDNRTRIYIELGANAEEARSRYLARAEAKNKSLIASRKPVTT